MKPRKTAFFPALVLSILSFCLFVEAQSKPNVSGTWKMNAGKSKFERGGPKAITIKLDHQGPTLHESVTIANDQGEQTANFTYTLDGKESLQQLEGEQIKATAKWEGEFLIIEFKGEARFNFLRKISVSGDGKTMTIDVKRSDPNGAANDTVVLEKQ